MTRAIKIKLHQQQAVYRNPSTSEIIETFPLPPPSTILGLICALTKQQHISSQINFSISGNHDTLIRDYQWFKKGKSLTTYPILVHMLFDVNLTLHIVASNDNLLDKIRESFLSPQSYMYLGRAEDLLNVYDLKFVDLKSQNFEEIELEQSHYIPLHEVKNISHEGIFYYLPTFMTLQQVVAGTKSQKIKSLRTFDWQQYHYFEKGNLECKHGSKCKILVDEEQPVWLTLPNQIQPQIHKA